MGVPSMPELLIILTIVVLLFGAKKIPDLAAGLGKGIKNFKKAIKDDDKIESKEKETTIVSTKATNENKTDTQSEATKVEESTSKA
jgi:sec-independent protein translocase protein TatA